MLAFASRSYITSLLIYLNCLISIYIQTFDINRRSDIEYLIFYSYVKKIKTDEFIEKIILENRQFHFDRLIINHDRYNTILEKILIANRDIRQRIRRGEHEPSINGILTRMNAARALSSIDEISE